MNNQEHILLVDNEKLNRETYSKIFIKAGFRVTAASNSKETFETLNKELPDLILLDITLDNESGLDILKKNKK